MPEVPQLMRQSHNLNPEPVLRINTALSSAIKPKLCPSLDREQVS